MDWVEYFDRNAKERMDIPWDRTITLSPQLRTALVASLQRFQIGESGEGKNLLARAAETGDASYAKAIRRFMFEERVHSELLEQLLQKLNATTLSSHWTDRLFIGVRRLIGLRMELMVLLSAEMIADYYYRLLRDRVPDPTVSTLAAQIVSDEQGHIAFHADFFRRQFAHLPRTVQRLLRLGFRLLYEAAVLLVLFDHRALLRALEVKPVEFVGECEQVFDRVMQHIFPATAGEYATTHQKGHRASPLQRI